MKNTIKVFLFLFVMFQINTAFAQDTSEKKLEVKNEAISDAVEKVEKKKKSCTKKNKDQSTAKACTRKKKCKKTCSKKEKVS